MNSYTALSQSENYHVHAISKDQKRLSPVVKLYITLTIYLLAFLVLTALAVSARHPRPTIYLSCGSNPTEARARNCSFDILSFAWQTPECYDDQLMTEFLSYHIIDDPAGWKFFQEPETNISVPLVAVITGELDAFVTWRYHIVHCTFMWRQMHRALARGWIDAHLNSYNHTLHCQNTLLERGIPDNEVAVQARVIYPLCEKVNSVESRSKIWDSVYS